MSCVALSKGCSRGLISALLVAFLLMPVSGVDTEPPVCSSALGYSVPCGPGWGLGAAAVVGLLVGWAVFRFVGKERRPR